jgi:hypothetical protein
MTAWVRQLAKNPFGRTALGFTFKNKTISKTSAGRAGVAIADDN